MMYESEIPLAERKEYVVVRMRLDGDQNEILGPTGKLPPDLRARVKSQGITGVNYVELDYVRDMVNYKTLPYNWKPQYIVIDALPSQTDIFFSGIRKVLDNLGEMDLAVTQKKFDELLVNLNTIIGGDGKNNAGIAKSVERLNVLLGRIDEVANKTELELLMREVIATTIALRQLLSSVQGDTISSVENLKQITDQLNDLAKVASRYPSSVVWGEPPARIVLPEVGVQK
jgi:ABC-type transporter Mla subunit MlaD